MAMGDALTGLGNRRQLDATLDQVLADAGRSNRPVSCLMVDVDHFKRFNDDFGHDAGDVVLRAVGAALSAAVRDKELAFRYGGEEFMVLMPGCDVDQASARAQYIRERIAELDLIHQGERLRKVTISVGVATAPIHCPADRLVQTADAALLRAKANGRDRAEVAMARADHQAA
jgi:diguanylate cyclase (GGDEF)-like protein